VAVDRLDKSGTAVTAYRADPDAALRRAQSRCSLTSAGSARRGRVLAAGFTVNRVGPDEVVVGIRAAPDVEEGETTRDVQGRAVAELAVTSLRPPINLTKRPPSFQARSRRSGFRSVPVTDQQPGAASAAGTSLITQRSQVQILPPLHLTKRITAGQGHDHQGDDLGPDVCVGKM
jgi:hypothetical protein